MSDDHDEGSSLVQALIRSGGLVFTGLVVEMVLSFLAKILMARILGPDGLGAVALGLAMFTFTTYIVLLGLDTGISRFMPRDEDPTFKRGVLVSALQIAIPLSLVCGGVLAALAPALSTELFGDPSTAPVLRVFAIAVPLSVLMKLSLGGIRGAKKSLPKVYLKNIFNPIVRFSAIGVVLYVGWNAVGIAWAYVVSYGLAVLLGLFYLYRHTPLFSGVSYVSKHRELVVFSAPLVVSTTMALLLDKFDTVMLGYFWSTSEVGIYNVVYPLAWALLVMLNAFRYLFMPTLSEMHSEGEHEEMNRVYQMTTKWVFLSTLPPFLGLVLFPSQILTVAFGPAYRDGAISLVILASAFFTHSIAGPNTESLTSIGKTRLIMYDNIVVAVVNVGLNLLFIPRFSYLGAAVATTFSYILLNVLYSYQLYQETGIRPLTARHLRPGVITAVGIVVLYLLVTARFGDGPMAMLIVATGMVVGYPLIIYRFGEFEPEERSTLRQLRDRFVVVSKVSQILGL